MYIEKAYSNVDNDSSSDEDVNPGGPLGAFREEQAMSQHRVSPSPFLSSSLHTTQLHYTNSYTYSHPNLNFLQYTIKILVPHVMWSVQAVHELKIDHTQCHLSALRRYKVVHLKNLGYSQNGFYPHTNAINSNSLCMLTITY